MSIFIVRIVFKIPTLSNKTKFITSKCNEKCKFDL